MFAPPSFVAPSPIGKKRACLTAGVRQAFSFLGDANYFFASSTDTLRNSFKSFVSSNAALRARVPAALLFFSTCADALVVKTSICALICSTKFFIILTFIGLYLCKYRNFSIKEIKLKKNFA